MLYNIKFILMLMLLRIQKKRLPLCSKNSLDLLKKKGQR